MRHRRKGFTLLELLTVIGVMLVLMSMAVIGYKVVGNNANLRLTHTNETNLEAMLTDLEVSQSLNGIYGFYGVNAAPTTPTAPVSSFYAGPIGVGSTNYTIGDVTTGSAQRQVIAPANTANVMTQTAVAMGIIARVPNNKTALGQIPAKSLMKDNNGGPLMLPIPGSTNTPAYVMLDGWSNPIILVPAGGIIVNVTDPASTTPRKALVRSSGIIAPVPSPLPPLKATDRPFWASAGPDGDFGGDTSGTAPAGDDNIYSFQK